MTKAAELSGRRFGRLTVVGKGERNPKRHDTMWRCQCDCGAQRTAQSNELTRGAVYACKQCASPAPPLMPYKDALTADTLRRLVSYCPETGIFSRLGRVGRCLPGSPIGNYDRHGYIKFTLCGFTYLAHRLAWLYVHGQWPDVIDHINGVRDDNRLVNLRDTTMTVNLQNKWRVRKDSRTQLLGVHVRGKKYGARIQAFGKKYDLGLFDSPDAAHAAYIDAKYRLHGPGAGMPRETMP